MVTGKVKCYAADAVVLATGGYGNVFYLSTNAKGCNTTAIWRAHKHGALFANPCFTQIHPTCIPPAGEHQSKLTLMSESLRNDGRIWVPRKAGDDRAAAIFPKANAGTTLKRSIRASATWCRVISLLVPPRTLWMPATASARLRMASTLTLRTLSAAWVRK
jgi:succinate dehydrogenase/fumarate reductase flavoprotein subunit